MDHSSEAAQVSPTGWYVAVLLERFEPRDADAADPVCEAYENTVLISADSAESAYAKALALGAGYDTDDLVGGPDRTPYVGRFGGLLELLPVYDELRDGCEIMYSRVSGTRSELASMVLHKSELAVFRAGEPDEGEEGGTST
jgi:hypothetical protein